MEPDEVLVQVHAASVNAADWLVLTGQPYLFRPLYGAPGGPRAALGRDVAGVVHAVGRDVRDLAVGDEVFGEAEGGAFAEFASVPAYRLVPKPPEVSFARAAATPVAALAALQGLRDLGGVGPGHQVLIHGAAGGVGTMALQLAKARGAEVTAVCSGRNAEQARRLGADHVVDYQRTDITAQSTRFDVMFDLVGNLPLAACRQLVSEQGVYVMAGGRSGERWLGPLVRMLAVLFTDPFVSQSMQVLVSRCAPSDLRVLAEHLEAQTVVPVIEDTYPLHELPEALRYLGQRHVSGKLVIAMA